VFLSGAKLLIEFRLAYFSDVLGICMCSFIVFYFYCFYVLIRSDSAF